MIDRRVGLVITRAAKGRLCGSFSFLSAIVGNYTLYSLVLRGTPAIIALRFCSAIRKTHYAQQPGARRRSERTGIIKQMRSIAEFVTHSETDIRRRRWFKVDHWKSFYVMHAGWKRMPHFCTGWLPVRCLEPGQDSNLFSSVIMPRSRIFLGYVRIRKLRAKEKRRNPEVAFVESFIRVAEVFNRRRCFNAM